MPAESSGSETLDINDDNDNGPGDGNVDMADFRRWRDWYLQANNIEDSQLHGAADHQKKDLNGDRDRFDALLRPATSVSDVPYPGHND